MTALVLADTLRLLVATPAPVVPVADPGPTPVEDIDVTLLLAEILPLVLLLLGLLLFAKRAVVTTVLLWPFSAPS